MPVSYRAAAAPPPRRGHSLGLARLCLFGRPVTDPARLPAACRHPDAAWRAAPVALPAAPLPALAAAAASLLLLPPLWPAAAAVPATDECEACDGTLAAPTVRALPPPPLALLLLLLLLVLLVVVANPRGAARLGRRAACRLARSWRPGGGGHARVGGDRGRHV